MVYRQNKQITNGKRIGKWLETSVGWARANIIYDTYPKTPEYGTLLEVMFMLVWKKKQIIQAMQVRAMAQSALGGKEAEQAYKDFVNELTQTAQEAKRDELRERLEDMKKIDAIRVTPLAPVHKTRNIKKA